MKTHLQAIKILLCALTLGIGVAAPAPSSGRTNILEGGFLRGASPDNDQPTNWVYVSAFQMDTNLVTYALWTSVYQWATNHGYSFSNAGSGFGANPVQSVNWYDVVKWCNARSKMGGFTPCYYTATGPNLQAVYTNGLVALKTN